MVRTAGLGVLFSCLLAASTAAAGDAFTPPAEADVDTLLAFMQRLAEPGREFASREDAESYAGQAAAAISAAADRVLDQKVTAEQATKAVEFQVRALRLLEALSPSGSLPGDARPSADEFVQALRRHAEPAVAFAALKTRLSERVPRWRVLSEAEKTELLTDVKDVIERCQPGPLQARLLTFLADAVGDTPDRGAVVELIKPLRARLAECEEEGMPSRLAALDGVLRRLDLPGRPIEVEGRLLDGSPVDWGRYRGKVVLIDYWATWCGLCHTELPKIRRLREQFGEEGFEVLGVSLDEDKRAVEEFLGKHALPWPTLFGHDERTRGWNHPMVEKYGIHNLPRAILVDRQGRVVSTNARGDRLLADVRRLFGRPRVAGVQGEEGLAATDEPSAPARGR